MAKPKTEVDIVIKINGDEYTTYGGQYFIGTLQAQIIIDDYLTDIAMRLDHALEGKEQPNEN